MGVVPLAVECGCAAARLIGLYATSFVVSSVAPLSLEPGDLVERETSVKGNALT
jgi:hypothetical protein